MVAARSRSARLRHRAAPTMYTMASDTKDAAGTYLGQKGYTVPKASLSVEEQRWLRDEMTVRPYLPKAPVQPPSFPVYRESGSKIYLPRHFGTATYGPADMNKMPPGATVSLEFAGELRPYQTKIVDAYMSCIHPENGGGGLLEVPCGRGKTVIALNVIARLARKTLVVVHKSFLLNQWVERIQQFLPGARVGRIQGQEVDTDDKDIVIGMLQSLSMKDYAQGTFASFGLTIVDECHHISSEVFSRSLLKIVTPCTLGLSATMQRKDGLTPVFKMFLGEVAYKEEQRTGDPVVVKAIKYSHADPEFGADITDYRGNPAYSSMITKLCDFSHRSEFILKVITHELSILEGQQVMVLSQNKSLLSYLYRAIEHRGIGTVGFYVGGMKEASLKETESRKIVLATYAMAAEALDIKTLTTLVLATPRTDVRQAVGRILRAKHDRPLVVDIIDMHQVFRSQWKKRETYFRRQGYTLTECKSAKYPGGPWKDLGQAKKGARAAPRRASPGGIKPGRGCLLQLPLATLSAESGF